ncbi:SH3 domain-containing protein [Pseudodesulfovibrio sp.]|uniref:SH3 domain-containing protein n=1 Tax=unclassified Pseudodesulfovibrio TaxID=2661612 RepID=UPI003B00B5C8
MRIKLLVLTAAWLLLLTGSALAFGRIAYPDRPLNLRASRSARAKWVGSLYPGQKVRIGFEKNGWVAVFESNETRADERYAAGFSNAKYLRNKRGRYEPEAWGEYVTVTRNLNIRSKPDIRGKRLDMLKEGEVVKVDFPDGDWSLVFRPDATIRSDMNGMGYASSKYFESAKAPAPVSKAASSPVVEAGKGPGQVAGKVTPPPAPKPEPEVIVPEKREVEHPVPMPPAQEKAAEAPKSVHIAESAKAKRSPELAPAPAAPNLDAAPTAGERKTIVIDRSRFTGAKRVDPTPNETAHGYQYRLLERSESRQYGIAWITLKVFLSTKVLPKADALKDFASTMWKENRRAAKNLAVLIYLPGMDTGDLSYAVIRFDDAGMIEYWVRKTTLIGTKFM